MRAVLDTNVLISALFWDGLPRRVVDLAIAGRFCAVTSPELLAELASVLGEDFGLPQDKVELAVRDTLSYAEVAMPAADIQPPVRDPADLMVIACAVGGRADCIVTGDHDLLALGSVSGVKVWTVREFLAELTEQV